MRDSAITEDFRRNGSTELHTTELHNWQQLGLILL